MLEQYKIIKTKSFENDIENVTYYISNNLKNKSAAKAMTVEIKNAILQRAKLPKAFKPYIYDKNKKVLYHVKVGNFYAFYYIDEKKKKIKYVSFLYAKMNVKNVLKVVNKNPLV